MYKLKNTISRTDAIKRVQNWLTLAQEKFGLTLENVPKAIFIPRADLDDAIHEFEKSDKQQRKASGIRIYFTKNLPTDGIHDLHLTCIVVPTVFSKKKRKDSNLPIHEDAIVRISSGPSHSVGAALARTPGPDEGGGGEGSEETIYDFTSPCPHDCEGTTNWVG